MIEYSFSTDISWKKDIIDHNVLILKKPSSNEERVVSSRVRGELIIFINNEKLSIMIHWGEFANISNANIYYNLNNYGFYEGNWTMSKDGKSSHCPDPKLFLMEILTTDTLTIGLRPKNNNEIRYIFDTSRLNEIIHDNIESFNLVSNLLSRSFASPHFPDKNSLNSFFKKQIKLKRDVRIVKDQLDHHDKYFFNPNWYMDDLSITYQLDSTDVSLFYYNRWLKKKGTLFTENDIRVLKFLNKRPIIIPYDTIYNVFLKGNSILGYRIHINDDYLTKISSSDKKQIESIVAFLKNRIKPDINN